MKYWFLILSCIIGINSIAQIDTTPPFKKFPTLPPLELTQLNNQLLTKDGLKKNTPTLIMFFSPECDHCQHQMSDILARMKDLNQFQIVLASHEPRQKLASFYNRYQLKNYQNILIGSDTKFLLPPFYKIRNFPYLAVYNQYGGLVTTYEGNVKIDVLLKAFNDNAAKGKPRSLKKS